MTMRRLTPFLCVECGIEKRSHYDRWFLFRIDRAGLSILNWNDDAADRIGFEPLCGESCAVSLTSKFATGGITALHRPQCAAPAHWTDTTVTAWVSSIFRSAHGNRLIVNYKDAGRDCMLSCFRRERFALVERTPRHYATFRIAHKGQFTNVLDVLKIDGQPVVGDSKKWK
jgi:hypothetical protein